MPSHLSNGALFFFPLHKIPTSCLEHRSLVFLIQFLNPLSSRTYIKSSRVKVRHSSSQRVPSASRSHAIKTTHIKRIKISRHLFRARVEDSRHVLKVIKAYFYAKYSFHPSLCQTSFPSPSASHFVVVDQSSVSSVELPFLLLNFRSSTTVWSKKSIWLTQWGEHCFCQNIIFLCNE